MPEIRIVTRHLRVTIVHSKDPGYLGIGSRVASKLVVTEGEGAASK